MDHSFVNNIFSNNLPFREKALKLFRIQYQENPVYQTWCNNLGVDPGKVSRIEEIPFLPVSFFKTHQVVSGNFSPEAVFESSGTTQMVSSNHYVRDLSLYKRSFLAGFELFFGKVTDWCIIGLLPSYLERNNSSLVVMTQELIQRSGHPESGFYLHDFQKLQDTLKLLEQQEQKTLLLGVTFALLDFSAQYPLKLHQTTVMETGGMKGRRKELTREAVHRQLKEQFGVTRISSEYGMTEMLSQAYAMKDGRFHTPSWLKLVIRDEQDPLLVSNQGKGILNVIDLANIYSCAFLATEDVGQVFPDGSFEVWGRVDNSDIRGCSLLAI